MRVAVVGANGFIGTHVCRSVAEHGFELIAVTRRPSTAWSLGHQRVVASMDVTALTEAFAGCQMVVNAAGAAHQRVAAATDAQQRFAAANRLLPSAIARAARAAGVGRLVHLSSAGVLGATSGSSAFDDHSEPRPHDPYTQSKLDAERVLAEALAGSDTQLLCLRPPLVYGKDAPGNFARIAAWARRGWPLPLGACSAFRAMIGVRNLANLAVAMGSAPNAPAGTLLCRDAETVTVAEFARAIARRVSRASLVVGVPLPLLSVAMVLAGRAADLERLTKPFQIDLSHGLARTAWRAPFSFEQEIAWSLAN